MILPRDSSGLPAQLIFIHVPKTGGVSLLRYIADVVGTGAVYHDPLGNRPRPDVIRDHTVLAGHWRLPEVRHLLESRFAFTILRDPIDLVLSKYHFYREAGALAAQWDPDVARAQAGDLNECLAAYEGQPWSAFGNFQVAMLASRATPCTSPAAMLSEAKRNLEMLSFHGLYEQLGRTASLLAEACGWPDGRPFPRLNVTSKRLRVNDLDLATRRRVIALNELDLELHAFAEALFRTREGSRSAGANRGFAAVSHARRETGPQHCRVTHVSTDFAADPATRDKALVDVTLEAEGACDSVVVGIAITDEHAATRCGVNSAMLGHKLSMKPGGVCRARFALDTNLRPGRYWLTVAVHREDGRNYHWIDDVLSFQVESHANDMTDAVDDCRVRSFNWTHVARDYGSSMGRASATHASSHVGRAH